MNKLTKHLLTLAIAAAAASPALANTVKFTGFTHGSQSVIATLATPNTALVRTVSAGGVNMVLNGGPSFEAYCVDLYQTIAFNTVYTDEYTTPASLTHSFTNSNAYFDIGRLFANAGPILDAVHEAAFQIAIWEIAYEKNTSYDITQGAASFAGTVGAMQLASGWLADLHGTPRTLGVIESALRQDMITPVPEPSTYLLMALGLLGITYVAKRRREQGAGRGPATVYTMA
ncbi:MAG: PEP-CTERM sorting domain-containing protein [Caldimonas sp.]